MLSAREEFLPVIKFQDVSLPGDEVIVKICDRPAIGFGLLVFNQRNILLCDRIARFLQAGLCWVSPPLHLLGHKSFTFATPTGVMHGRMAAASQKPRSQAMPFLSWVLHALVTCILSSASCFGEKDDSVGNQFQTLKQARRGLDNADEARADCPHRTK